MRVSVCVQLLKWCQNLQKFNPHIFKDSIEDLADQYVMLLTECIA